MNQEDKHRLATLRLARTPGLGARGFARLMARFNTPADALDALPGYARSRGLACPGVPTTGQAEDELAAIDKAGARLLAWGLNDYPAGLRSIPDPPPCLIARGRTALLEAPACAIVGSRNASAAGMRIARTLGQTLGAEGVVIVSGLARGIDGAAHQGSLATGTIAVLAGGVDHIYPPEHARLHEEIARAGLILSERQLGAIPTARCFPRRNRIISGLALGSLIVEAALRSGSLITARCAAEQNREVMAVPGSPLDPRARGTNQLLRDGAHLVETADDVLAIISAAQPLAIREALPANAQAGWTETTPGMTTGSPRSGMPDTEPDRENETRRVLDLLSPVPVSLDEIARQSGRDVAFVLAEVLELELAGEITVLPSGTVQRR